MKLHILGCSLEIIYQHFFEMLNFYQTTHCYTSQCSSVCSHNHENQMLMKEWVSEISLTIFWESPVGEWTFKCIQ
jgi:hypothetical protein